MCEGGTKASGMIGLRQLSLDGDSQTFLFYAPEELSPLRFELWQIESFKTFFELFGQAPSPVCRDLPGRAVSSFFIAYL